MQISTTVSLADVLNGNDSKQLELAYQSQSHMTIHGNINTDAMTQLLNLSESLKLQIGIDEAGRGPLLGSVVVGAVILPPNLSVRLDSELGNLLANTPLYKLNDSKKISEKKRDELYKVIPEVALGYVSVDVPATIIDEINILQASLQGMRVAVNVLLQSFTHTFMHSHHLADITFELLFDGNKQPEFTSVDYACYADWGINTDKLQMEAVIKGDSKFASISAGSIIAKVERDQKMYQLAQQYPDYGIEQHKGYPTKAHLQALEKHGVIDEHRRSFAPVQRCLAV